MSSSDAPQILVFAGPNGSGKSSVTLAWQTVGLYINADDIKAKRGSGDLEAADVCRIVDNTGEPETIYAKDEHGAQIRPNRYWSADAIKALL